MKICGGDETWEQSKFKFSISLLRTWLDAGGECWKWWWWWGPAVSALTLYRIFVKYLVATIILNCGESSLQSIHTFTSLKARRILRPIYLALSIFYTKNYTVCSVKGPLFKFMRRMQLKRMYVQCCQIIHSTVSVFPAFSKDDYQLGVKKDLL